MVPWPILRRELARSSNRWLGYFLRMVTVTVLTIPLWISISKWGGWEPWSTGIFPAFKLRDLGWKLVALSLFMQSLFLFQLLPLLCAGVFAEERQRKTLGHWLVTPLSPREIILAKVIPALGQGLQLVVVLFPLGAIPLYFGGMEPMLLLLLLFASFMNILFSVVVSVWVGMGCRKVSSAVGLAIGVLSGWVYLPILISAMSGPGWSPWQELFDWTRTGILAVFGWSSLVWVGFQVVQGATLSWWMCVRLLLTQTAVLLVLMYWIVRRFLPIALDIENSPEVPPDWSDPIRKWRWSRRPPCGDDAILWKDTYFIQNRNGKPRNMFEWVFLYAFVVLALVMFLVFLVTLSYNFMKLAVPAFWELWAYGYDPRPAAHVARDPMYFSYLRFLPMCAWIFLSVIQGMAVLLVTQERDQDTWTTLLASPLGDGEILESKALSVMNRISSLLAFVVFGELLGVAFGLFFPLTALLAIVTFLALTRTVLWVALRSSLRAKTPATARTISALWFLGITLLCLPALASGGFSWKLVLDNLADPHWAVWAFLAYSLVSCACIVLAAWLLPRRVMRSAELYNDRPVRPVGKALAKGPPWQAPLPTP